MIDSPQPGQPAEDVPYTEPVTYTRPDDFLYDHTLQDSAGQQLAATAAWAVAIGGFAHRRTRGAAALGLSVLLSRAHGYARRRLEALVCGLFDQRTALKGDVAGQAAQIAQLRRRCDNGERRLRALERCFGGDPQEWLRQQQATAEYVPAPNADNDCGASG